ncbi:MAG: pyridoxal phosphate-dependent aminotransferase [Lachnospirales bacterium]
MLSHKAMNVKPSTTLAITARAKELKSKGIDVVAFTAGEPDFNTPDKIKESAINAIHSNFTKYTKSSGIDELKQEIANKLKKDNSLSYTKDEIVVSNGGKHALINALAVLINAGDEVLIVAPYWLSYVEMVKLNDGIPIIIETDKKNQYKVNKELLNKYYSPKCKVLILNSPSNPTGIVYAKQELEEIANFAKEKNIFIISDEIYEYLIYDNEKHISIAQLEDMYQRTIIVNGFSKAYAMTGWRLGYTAAPLEISKAISAIQSHMSSNPSSISQYAALGGLTNELIEIKDMVKEFDRRRKYLFKEIKKLPFLDCNEPKGAFYLLIDTKELNNKTHKNNKITDAATVADILLNEYNVAVIPCKDFGAPNAIRLSYAISMEDIKAGVTRINEFIQNCK